MHAVYAHITVTILELPIIYTFIKYLCEYETLTESMSQNRFVQIFSFFSYTRINRPAIKTCNL